MIVNRNPLLPLRVRHLKRPLRTGAFFGSVALTATRHYQPTDKASLCSKTEQLVYQTDFACHAPMTEDAVTAADHAHDLESPNGGGGCLHPLEATRRPDHAFERTMIRFNDVVQVF